MTTADLSKQAFPAPSAYAAPEPVWVFDPRIDCSVNATGVVEQLDILAGNTGNMMFMAPLRQQIANVTWFDNLDNITSEIRTLVLSFGNWVSPDTDMSAHANRIEYSNIERVVVLGVGAQAQAGADEIKLQPGTRRFLDIVAERSVSIGVRGDFTADVLEQLGVKNVDVIGCPSVFMIRDALRERPAFDNIRVAVNTTWHGHYRDAIDELFAFGEAHDALLVEQSERSMLQFCVDRLLSPGVQFRARYYSEDPQGAWRLLDWWRRRLVYYVSLESWKNSMNNVDLVVGSRFHGGIVALLSGARSLFLTMDTRTKELVEYFNLPHMRFQDFDREQSSVSYYEKADPSFFLATLPDRKRRYQAFLKKNGLILSSNFDDEAPDDIESALLLPKGPRGVGAATTRFLQDSQEAALDPKTVAAELRVRSSPLRSTDEGARVEKSEFVIPYAERVGRVSPRPRVSWHRRQGVADTYRHQADPEPFDDRGLRDQWQREVYENAEHIARQNKYKRIVDFGCGSGFKLMKYFGNYETVGIEVEPALSALAATYPDRKWLGGDFILPSLFDGELVICADVIEHLSEPDYLLQAMAASHATVFVLSTPALEILADRGTSSRAGPPRNKAHVFEWSTSEFRVLVSQYLNVVAHAIVNLAQATQMCVATRKDVPAADCQISELICI